MDIFIKAVQLLLSLSFLVILHELGHFIPAKLFKTRVEKFYLFFDYKFSIFKKKIGETEYGIGWIPLGGYVKISGMIDESMDTKQLKQAPKPWEFRSKPAWQRLIIMLGGVVVNFIIGWTIYVCLLWSYGEQFLPNENLKDGIYANSELSKLLGVQTGDKIISIDGVKPRMFRELTMDLVNGNEFTIERGGKTIKKEINPKFISRLVELGKNAGPVIGLRQPFVVAGLTENSINKNSGLQAKDIVTAINGQAIKYFDQGVELLNKFKGQSIILDVKRDGKPKQITVNVSEKGKIETAVMGIKITELEKIGYLKLKTINYSLTEAIPAGTLKTWNTLKSYVKQLKKVFNPSTGAYKGMGGFISIGSIFPTQFQWYTFWSITAFLSIMLGFMNLLPIPALDGGHVMFTLWEIITGKKPNDKFLEYAQITGFLLLLTLLIFSNANDIIKLLTN